VDKAWSDQKASTFHLTNGLRGILGGTEVAPPSSSVICPDNKAGQVSEVLSSYKFVTFTISGRVTQDEHNSSTPEFFHGTRASNLA
jgi:hypothetical protein